MPNPTFFFSDAHLGAPLLDDDAAREAQVSAFLEYAAGLDGTIVIAGDLFEFWFEYRETIPRRNFGVLARMRDLARDGATIHYLAGNHDLWIGSFLEQDIGVQVHANCLDLTAGSLRVHATHGDGAAPSDRGYRFIKRVFRHPLNIGLFRWLHPDLGIPLARRLSQVSRDHGDKPSVFAEEYKSYALEKLENGQDVVIMGHTHTPFHERARDGHYINLGDWIRHYTYCRIQDNDVSLRRWPTHDPWEEPKLPSG